MHTRIYPHRVRWLRDGLENYFVKETSAYCSSPESESPLARLRSESRNVIFSPHVHIISNAGSECQTERAHRASPPTLGLVPLK